METAHFERLLTTFDTIGNDPKTKEQLLCMGFSEEVIQFALSNDYLEEHGKTPEPICIQKYRLSEKGRDEANKIIKRKNKNK